VDGVEDFKFGRQIDRSKSQPSDDKSSLKTAWSGHVNHLNFEARVIKFCIQVGYTKSRHMENNSPLKGAWSGSRDAFKILRPSNIPGLAEARVVKFCTQVDYIISKPKDDKPPLKGRGQFR